MARHAEGSRLKQLVTIIPYGWLIAFFFVPFCLIFKISLSDQTRARPPYVPQLNFGEGLSGLLNFLRDLDFENFTTLGTDYFYLRSYLHSVQTAILATFLILLIAYPLAYGITRTPQKWRTFLLTLVILPFWTSFLVRVYAWMTILKPNGFLDMAAQSFGFNPGAAVLLNTDSAVVIGIVYTYLPFMVLPLFATLDKLDDSLLEAARDLGASAFKCFTSITIPLSLPGILAGCLLVFIPILGEFVIPDLLGGTGTAMIGKTLWTEFFDNQDWPLSAAIAVGMLIILVFPIIVLQRIQAATATTEISNGNSGASRRFSLVNWSAVFLGLTFIYLPIFLVIIFSFNNNRLVTVWGLLFTQMVCLTLP